MNQTNEIDEIRTQANLRALHHHRSEATDDSEHHTDEMNKWNKDSTLNGPTTSTRPSRTPIPIFRPSSPTQSDYWWIRTIKRSTQPIANVPSKDVATGRADTTLIDQFNERLGQSLTSHGGRCDWPSRDPFSPQRPNGWSTWLNRSPPWTIQSSLRSVKWNEEVSNLLIHLNWPDAFTPRRAFRRIFPSGPVGPSGKICSFYKENISVNDVFESNRTKPFSLWKWLVLSDVSPWTKVYLFQ